MTTPTQDPLCDGSALAYKFFKRRLNPNQTAGALILVATCEFGSTGWSIYFAPAGDLKFDLRARPPQGIFNPLNTIYAAVWNGGLELAEPPADISITDAFGTHTIPLEDWPA